MFKVPGISMGWFDAHEWYIKYELVNLTVWKAPPTASRSRNPSQEEQVPLGSCTSYLPLSAMEPTMLNVKQINMKHNKLATAKLAKLITGVKSTLLLIQEPYCFRGMIKGLEGTGGRII
ncbi:unnamed protein product [Nezara viridula]|uniref:Uncharacterized protein n=1 Tax=Nezara viridula TaxID=85310 RepID=A0A9P0EDS3_NEZVI|nr:unnamed protein product [Nezara viridula]